MAEQLLLVRTYDFEADQDSVNLLTRSVDGFEPAYQGWIPNLTPDRNGRVKEALTVRVNGASTDALATSLQKLADKAEQTRRFYADGIEDYAVWLRVQTSGETKGRQSLVYEVRHEPASSVFDASLRASYHWNKYTIGIDRAPWWEGTAAGTITASSVSMYGGTFSYGTINGDLAARMARVRMEPLTIAVPQGTAAIWPYGQFWLGFRSNRYSSTPSAWVSWRNAVSPGAEVTDTYAVGGTAIRSAYHNGTVDFTDNYLISTETMDTMTGGTPEHMFGSFLVLARAKAAYVGTADFYEGTSSLNFYLHMVAGFSQDSNTSLGVYRNARHYPRVAASVRIEGTTNNADYYFYELGEVTFPPPGRKNSTTDWGAFSIYILADPPSNMSDFAGTAYLYLDGMAFIPTEGLYWGGRDASGLYDAPSTNVAGGSVAYYGYNGPDDRSNAIVAGTGLPSYTYGANQPYYKGGIPIGSGIGVLAANALMSSGTAWKANIELRTVERWQFLRGND